MVATSDGRALAAADGKAPSFFLSSLAPLPNAECFFTTLLVRRGVASDWRSHKSRLTESCAEIFALPLPGEIDQDVAGAAADHHTGALRVVLQRKHGRVESTVALSPTPTKAHSVHLATVGGRRGRWDHKWCDRRQLEEASSLVGEGQIPLFLSDENGVLETTWGNVASLIDGTLVFPQQAHNVLPGVTRAHALRAAARLGLRALEAPIELDEALLWPMLTCSSLRGLVPVATIDTRRLPALPRAFRSLRDEVSGRL